ncbi:Superfamily I DNA and RNA helicases [Flavobacterium succinicans]|uniref:DNA 3'-5' helicase II n=1 Tax=Flavobacterium succinicans TaxID=29536 RepID=A0A1I5A461_9FLAO|nr:ATP-binding domain-containing protein [Flavobacterium succinicans]SFN57183.1 Superfamily I DNA and RNA helicases [Flavobacterium succinicans]
MELIADYSKLKNDPIASILVEKIQSLDIDNSNLYYNFPLYRGETKDDLIQAHVLLVSKKYGVIFFRCINNPELYNDLEKKKMDDLDGHIFARINKVDELRIKRRELKIFVTPKIFVNSEITISSDEFINLNLVEDAILQNEKEILTEEEFLLLSSAIEGSVHLRNKKEREISKKLSKGDVLNIIQSQHSAFDIEQKKAALNIIDSPQRIRGLAGSGKTIILAMKVALYHLQNPDAEILYTYFTKALYGQIKYLIEKYYRDFADNNEPDWTKIHILHGWGGTGLRGVYSDTCQENNVTPIGFLEARANAKNPFNYIFSQLNKLELITKYDLTLIDEGQDFPASFYQVCRKITKNMRIVWAYDDFQNIFDVNIQDEKETFGKDENGVFYVDFARDDNTLQDIVLHKCYRNPRLALINAFALGLGIYNDNVLQRLEDNNHWIDLGFTIEKGDSSDGCEMVISRPLENSPIITNDYFKDDSIQIEIFDDVIEECKYVCSKIIEDIKIENLRPDDISVIGIDNKHIGYYFDTIQEILNNNNIATFNLLNASNNNTKYSIANHVTLSTLNKAKGNESGMVYIVGTEYAFRNKDYIIDRNKIFTAITRSKGWVVLTGFEKANQCKKEMDFLKKNDYKFIFKQPSEYETKTILRGMTKQQGILNDITTKMQELSKIGLTQEEIIALLKDLDKDKK